MRWRTRLSLLLLLMLGLGIGLPLAQIRFDKPPSGTSYQPVTFSGSSSALLNVTDASSNEFLKVDTTSPLGIVRAMQHTITLETDASGILEKGAFQSNPTWTPAQNSTTTVSGLGGTITTGGTANVGRIFGVVANANHHGSGPITNLIGSRIVSAIGASRGPATNMMGLYLVLQHNNAASIAASVAAIQIDLNKFSAGPMTAAKALYVRSGYGGVTTKHGIYIEDTSAMNY